MNIAKYPIGLHLIYDKETRGIRYPNGYKRIIKSIEESENGFIYILNGYEPGVFEESEIEINFSYSNKEYDDLRLKSIVDNFQ
jgi:hypothetical protein